MSKILILFLLLSSSTFANLSESNFEKAKNCLGKAESNNNYKAVNRLRYLGRYQFGAQALEDIGYTKKGCYKKYKNNIPKSCWIKSKSKEDFLNSPKIQDTALEEFFELNYNRLLNNKTLTKKSSQTEIAQALFVSHLLGTHSAKKFFKDGINNKDANGTTAKKYSEIAKGCIK